jgi:hypothetical protein
MISKYYLHDSLVEDIRYLQDEKKLKLEIELCNWRQPSYQDGEPEILKLDFIFTDVTKFEMEPETMLFESDEILEISSTITDVFGNEAIKMVLRGEEEVKIVNIIANEVLVVKR